MIIDPFLVFAIFGTILVIIIILSRRDRNPTRFQEFTLRTLFALSVAGIAFAAIPGDIQVRTDFGTFELRASSAIAVFVFLYLLNPPTLIGRPSIRGDTAETDDPNPLRSVVGCAILSLLVCVFAVVGYPIITSDEIRGLFKDWNAIFDPPKRSLEINATNQVLTQKVSLSH